MPAVPVVVVRALLYKLLRIIKNPLAIHEGFLFRCCSNFQPKAAVVVVVQVAPKLLIEFLVAWEVAVVAALESLNEFLLALAVVVEISFVKRCLL
jgi:hypothetical protein